jgi:cytochrome P450 family 142 subfamily A polypeptide 1
MSNHPGTPNIKLIDHDFWGSDPHPHLQWLRENAPVYRDEASGVWGIARYEDLRAVATNTKDFCNGGGIRPDAPALPHMIDLDGAPHRRRRSLVSKGFTPRRIAEREARIREICVGLIDTATQRRKFEFVKDVAAWLPLIVIGDMLAIEPEYHERLLRWSDECVCGAGAVEGEERFERAFAAMGEYTTYQKGIIEDRRTKPLQDDLTSILVHAEIDGERLDDDTILWESLLILIGGDETTRHVISGGMYELMRNPDQYAKLVADPSKIPTAVEEMLRWVSPIKNMTRTALHDTEVGGQDIKAGDKLLLLYPSANRDADVFPEPDRFDIERAPNDHVAFGFGPHFCLGSSLARLELRVMFEEVVRRMPGLRLATDEPPPRRASNFISGIERMPVTLDA